MHGAGGRRLGGDSLTTTYTHQVRLIGSQKYYTITTLIITQPKADIMSVMLLLIIAYPRKDG